MDHAVYFSLNPRTVRHWADFRTFCMLQPDSAQPRRFTSVALDLTSASDTKDTLKYDRGVQSTQTETNL